MAVKIVVLYPPPPDPESWDKHYLTVHMPMVAKIPGLVKSESAKAISAPDGSPSPWYRTAELWFESPEAMAAAFGSPEGAAVGQDFAEIAPPGAVQFIAAVD